MLSCLSDRKKKTEHITRPGSLFSSLTLGKLPHIAHQVRQQRYYSKAVDTIRKAQTRFFFWSFRNENHRTKIGHGFHSWLPLLVNLVEYVKSLSHCEVPPFWNDKSPTFFAGWHAREPCSGGATNLPASRRCDHFSARSESFFRATWTLYAQMGRQQLL